MTIRELVVPGTRFTNWRLRSRLCAAIDLITVAAGAILFVLAALDSIVAWPANHVLVTDRQLSRVAGSLLGPGWTWLLVSAVIVFGISRNRWQRPPRWPVRVPVPARIGILVAAGLCIAVIAGGFAIGAAKGDARVLTGSRYQVSTLDLNNADWTPVSRAQYEEWQARFVREDGIFMVFGLFLVAGSLGLVQLHRAARRAPAP